MKHFILFICLLCLPASAKVYEVTAYCSCAKCCGKWSGGPTASGRQPVEGVTVAASRSIPFGTRLQIEGLGIRRVDDRLAKRYDNRVDVYFSSHEKAKKFGIRKLRVSVVRAQRRARPPLLRRPVKEQGTFG